MTAKKEEYKYSTLASLSDKTTDDVHFYGTIVDSSFTYKTEKRSIVTCKVVDSSLVKKGTVSPKDWVTVVFYAKANEDLPIIQRIGDILRVHRAEFQHFNDQKQLNVNLFFKGSWCLFTGNEKDEPLEPKVVNEDKDPKFFSFTPYNFSGKSFTWGDEDSNHLKNLRKWTQETFSKNFVVESTVDSAAVEKAIKAKTDFDLVGRVTALKSADAFSNQVSIVDAAGTTWTAQTFKKKYPHLAVGSCVRVRSVNGDAKHNLTFAGHSNILHFISGSKILTVLSKVAAKAAPKATPSKATGKATPSKAAAAKPTAAISTITDKKNAKLATTALNSLFFNPGKTTSFRAQFHVIKTDPAKDWNKKPKTAYNIIVQDHNNTEDVKAYKIQIDDNAFFGTHKPEEARALLTTKGNWVDAILTRKDKNYSISGTKLS
jgi:hypothetical protein